MTRFASLALSLLICAATVHARDISGTITTTLTITDDSQLVGDVTCALSGAACIQISASSVTLKLNGFTITGEADPETACGGQITESGAISTIGVTAQTDVNIEGPGLIQRSRGFGIVIGANSARVKVTGVTLSTNCRSGIFVSGASENELTGNVSIRNGSPIAPCGGICLLGASRNRLSENRLIGNGYIEQGNNFGIGLIDAGDDDNTIEDNTVVGNANGITIAAGAERNIFRRNLVTGNPPVQVAADHSSIAGVDIRNLSGSDTNTFQANVCLTSVNAPCPALETSLTASPNPILATGSSPFGMTTISWNAPGAEVVEVHVGSPNGPLFARGGYHGSAQTALWVADGATFYLQDVSGGKLLTAENTLATVEVHVQRR